jgi:hypothetical protein
LTASAVNADTLLNADVANAAENQILATDGNGNLTVETQAGGPNPYDQAQTFVESSLTLARNNTRVSGGSVELGLAITTTIDDVEDGDITTTPSNWDGWKGDTGSLTAQQGTVLYGSYSLELSSSGSNLLIETERDSETTAGAAFSIQVDAQSSNSGDGVWIDFYTPSGSIVGSVRFNDGSNVTYGGTELLSSWSVDTTYDIEWLPDFSSDTADIYINGSLVGENISNSSSQSGFARIAPRNIVLNSGISRNLYIDNVGLLGDATAGDALIEWDKGVPTDIFAWDVATFTRTLDNETVTVDVEDGSGTVLLSDINRNTDISSVAANTNVKLRVNLSRSDTSNNPTLDSAYRSWLV